MNRLSCLLVVPALLLCLLPGCRPDNDDEDENSVEITPAVAVPHPEPATDPALTPVIARDDTRVHMVYAQRTAGGIHDLMYTNRIGAGSWTAPAPLFPSSAVDSRNPHLFLDHDGTLHVVWEEGTSPNRDIYYVTRTAAGAITQAVNLTSSVADEANPRIHVDSTGRVHVVWTGISSGPPVTTAIFYTRTSGSLFLTPVVLPKANGDQDADLPDITTDAGNRVYVVWSEQNGPARNIRMVRSDDNGQNFGGIGNGFAASGSVDMTHARVKGGTDGEVFLCFIGQDSQGERALMVSYTRTGGTFAAPGQLDSSNTNGIRDPVLSAHKRAEGKYTVAIAYNDGSASGGNILVRASRDNGATYPGKSVNLSQGNTQPSTNRRPAVTINGSEVTVAWEGEPQGGGVARIWCSLNSYSLP
jgi:hypothetical protein